MRKFWINQNNKGFARLKTVSILFALNSCLFLGSCNKTDETGLGILPSSDEFGVNTDTLGVSSITVKGEAIRTDNASVNLLGEISDNTFGTSKAGFYTQLTNSTNFSYTQFDSVVLTLAYAGHYGDLNSSLKIRVYELTSDLVKSKTQFYYSNSTTNHESTPIAEVTVRPNTTDNVIINKDTLAPHLRIKLDDKFGQSLISKASTINGNGGLKSAMKGFYVEASLENGKGAILYFNLTSDMSALTVFDTDTAKHLLSYNFKIDNDCAKYNVFSNDDYKSASSDVQKQINSTDVTLGQQKCYVQAMGGLRTKISFPDLANINLTGKHIINKAELVIKADGMSEDELKNIILGINYRDANGVVKPILDYDILEDNIGGRYDAVKKEYRIILSSQLQKLLDGDIKDNGLYIEIVNKATTANALTIKGSGVKNYIDPSKMKLIIHTTKLN